MSNNSYKRLLKWPWQKRPKYMHIHLLVLILSYIAHTENRWSDYSKYLCQIASNRINLNYCIIIDIEGELFPH